MVQTAAARTGEGMGLAACPGCKALWAGDRDAGTPLARERSFSENVDRFSKIKHVVLHYAARPVSQGTVRAGRGTGTGHGDEAARNYFCA